MFAYWEKSARVVVWPIQNGWIITGSIHQVGEDRIEVSNITVSEGIDAAGARWPPLRSPQLRDGVVMCKIRKSALQLFSCSAVD